MLSRIGVWSSVPSTGKGGTWEGAIEALKKEFIYVRLDKSAPDGNRQLLEMGALAFPEQPWENLAQIITESNFEHSSEAQSNIDFDLADTPEAQITVLAENDAAQSGLTKTAFDAVLPLLLECLKQPRDLKFLADSLDVRSDQVKDWINRAMAKGQVAKQGKPVRYVAKRDDPKLFNLENISLIILQKCSAAFYQGRWAFFSCDTLTPPIAFRYNLPNSPITLVYIGLCH